MSPGTKNPKEKVWESVKIQRPPPPKRDMRKTTLFNDSQSVTVWNRALSKEEIEMLFQKPIHNVCSIAAWHKDGIIYDPTNKVKGKVYIDGKLANTRGKHRHITITWEKVDA
jgi:hypothetical protein